VANKPDDCPKCGFALGTTNDCEFCDDIRQEWRALVKCECGRLVEGRGDSGFGPEFSCECGSLWTG
jgi:hypothetical protein